MDKELMDKDHLKVNSPTDGHKQKIHKDAETDTDVPQPSIRRSACLQSKITSPSDSKDAFKSLENDNNGVPSADIAFVKSASAVPPFLYHSRSDDGIQLVVDLNLKTSDWLKNMAKEVSVVPNHPKPDFGSFRKEVESLSVRNSQKIISLDITAAKDASMNSHVQKEVITVSSSKYSGSKVEQKSELVDVDSQTTKMPEIQFSDIISCPNDSLARTTKINQETGSDHPRAIVENKEKMNTSEETAVLREENALMMTPAASDVGSKRKKPCRNSDNIHSQSHERILRSTKLYSLTSTAKVNQEAGGDHRQAIVKVKEKINASEETAVSREENTLMMTPGSEVGSERKKPCRNSDNIHSQSHERILRSTKLYSLTSTAKANQEAGGDHRPAIVENKEKINASKEMAVSREENALVMTPASDVGSKRKKPSDNSDNIHSQSHERILRSTKLYSLTSTAKVNQEAGGDHRLAIVESKEKINSSEETAVSREENALMIMPASDVGSKRKKPCHNSDNIHSQSHERILRSTKLYSLTSTAKVNQEAGGDHRRAIVENKPWPFRGWAMDIIGKIFPYIYAPKEKINSSEEMAVSREENTLMIMPASDVGSTRKKPCRNSDNIHSQSHERSLRSTKLFGAQIVEHDGVVTRCSSRLNTK